MQNIGLKKSSYCRHLSRLAGSDQRFSV